MAPKHLPAGNSFRVFLGAIREASSRSHTLSSVADCCESVRGRTRSTKTGGSPEVSANAKWLASTAHILSAHGLPDQGQTSPSCFGRSPIVGPQKSTSTRMEEVPTTDRKSVV